MKVQVVDFKSADAPKQFAKSLHETGFGVITNHDIPVELFQNTYSQWLEFFNSGEAKNYPFDSQLQDGYFPKGAETHEGKTIADNKEFYQIYPNGRVPECVQEITWEYRAKLFKIAITLLGWLEEATPSHVLAHLDRPLSEMVCNERTMLRILHYPPLTGEEQPGEIRGQEHGDINFLTVLPSASEPGLQVKDTSGNWHDVPSDFGNISINIGDMLSMITKGYYPSTPHQIINPVGAKRDISRMSTPLFLHPEKDQILKPGFTAEDYLDQRLKNIGIRKRTGETPLIY